MILNVSTRLTCFQLQIIILKKKLIVLLNEFKFMIKTYKIYLKYEN